MEIRDRKAVRFWYSKHVIAFSPSDATRDGERSFNMMPMSMYMCVSVLQGQVTPQL